MPGEHRTGRNLLGYFSVMIRFVADYSRSICRHYTTGRPAHHQCSVLTITVVNLILNTTSSNIRIMILIVIFEL